MLRLWKRIRRNAVAEPPRRELFASPPRRFERLACLQAMAIVAAKLAKCDGPVCRSEIDCFKRLFPLAAHEQAVVAPLFNLARESPEGFEPFAGEIVRMLGADGAEQRVVFDCFVEIGRADGALNGEELSFLGELARSLQVEEHWERVRTRVDAEAADPYAVLGVESDISDQELRAVWHRLIRRFHPDANAARGGEEMDHTRLAAINAAYGRIRRSRRQAGG